MTTSKMIGVVHYSGCHGWNSSGFSSPPSSFSFSFPLLLFSGLVWGE
jgi:hypothetical protein